jgi:hypothetical protein
VELELVPPAPPDGPLPTTVEPSEQAKAIVIEPAQKSKRVVDAIRCVFIGHPPR